MQPYGAQVGAVTKAFKDASATADASGYPALARLIRDHPKVLEFRRIPAGSSSYGGFMRRSLQP